MKVYGPYTRKDGRKHVILYDGVSRKTVSYPKFLMEQYLGRKLTDDETVDHINNDFTDDRLENLQILSRVDNIKKSAPAPEVVECICLFCEVKFTRFARNYRGNQLKQKKKGPFCSRSCAGKGTHPFYLGDMA